MIEDLNELLTIDAEALAYGQPWNWENVLSFAVDWREARELSKPRPEPQRRNLARWRQSASGKALEQAHEYCGDPTRYGSSWHLGRQRPGARNPAENCQGCPLSYLGPTPALTGKENRKSLKGWRHKANLSVFVPTPAPVVGDAA